MTLYAFLNMLMVIACCGALGYLAHYFLSRKLVKLIANHADPLVFLHIMVRRMVWAGISIGVIMAVIITPVGAT